MPHTPLHSPPLSPLGLLPLPCLSIDGLVSLQVFDILIQGLFDPTQRLPAETQRTYVQLLATAAAAVDDRSAHAYMFNPVDAEKRANKKSKEMHRTWEGKSSKIVTGAYCPAECDAVFMCC